MRIRLLSFVVSLLAAAGCVVAVLPGPPLGYRPAPLSTQAQGVTMRVLHTATLGAVESFLIEGGGIATHRLPVTAYVIEHPTEGIVLVDTGFSKRTGEDPTGIPGTLVTAYLQMEMKPGQSVTERLEDIGRTAGDVKHAIFTHLHIDHSGGLEDFPDATAWADAREVEAAFTRPLIYNKEPLQNRERFTAIDFDDGPYGTFDAHADLFGDGSVIVLPTPVHTAGHVSVIVNLESRSFLLTGDTAWLDWHWQRPEPKAALISHLEEDDWEANLDALWRLRTLAELHPELEVIAGHEPANLTRLRAWPEAYE